MAEPVASGPPSRVRGLLAVRALPLPLPNGTGKRTRTRTCTRPAWGTP
ncbi:hypothetical protein [Streptomyces sp. YU58]|nr:hypothetical protein [Streptomyces coralus]WLW54338.1 hypothetical protein QU709_24600 [Streptomyces coralus]